MFAVYTQWRKTTSVGESITAHIRAHFKSLGWAVPIHETCRHWVKVWDNNGGKFVTKENREYTRNPRKVDSRVLKQLKKRLTQDSPSFRQAHKKK